MAQIPGVRHLAAPSGMKDSRKVRAKKEEVRRAPRGGLGAIRRFVDSPFRDERRRAEHREGAAPAAPGKASPFVFDGAVCGLPAFRARRSREGKSGPFLFPASVRRARFMVQESTAPSGAACIFLSGADGAAPSPTTAKFKNGCSASSLQTTQMHP